MSPLKVVHLVYYGYESTVVDSQVVTPARLLAARDIQVELVFLEDPIPWLLGRWRARKAELSAMGLRTHFLPRIPRNFLQLNTRRLDELLPRLGAGQPRLVVHARGFQGADSVLPVRSRHPELRVICDARGIEWAEYELGVAAKRRPPNIAERLWKRALESIERRAVAGSDVVFCVSRSMIPFLKDRAPGAAGPFEHVPCAVDVDSFSSALASRAETRRELGVSSGRVLAYAGSMSPWQIPGEVVTVADRFLRRDPAGKFLVLTPTPERFSSLAASAGIPRDRLLARRVRHADVPRYLAAADLALLLRGDNLVNRHACPTKFAEYLACGLHVLATPAVNEVADTIRRTGCGTIVDRLDDPGVVDAAIEAALAACGDDRVRSETSVAAARGMFDWSRHIATVEKWYRRLSSDDPIQNGRHQT